jgi:hypothetical protein
MQAAQILVPTTHYKIGDTLRVTIEAWAKASTINNHSIYLAHDPMNRATSDGDAMTFGTEPTILTAQIPIKVDILMEKNITSASTTNMNDNVPSYSVAPMQTDSTSGNKETEWMNTKASQYFGYYKKIPEVHTPFNSFATWIVGKGYETEDAESQVILDHIKGWGEDTFNSIMWNLMVQKKVYGDAFAEIIRADDKDKTLLNLKPLYPAKMKIIVNEKGILLRYEQMDVIGKDGKSVQVFQPEEILHLCNDRVSDQIHGNSLLEANEWVILAKNEIMDDYRTVLHRNVVPVRILEVDTDDPVKVAEIRVKYETAIKNKEVIIVPKGTVSITTDGGTANAIINPMPFLNYLDNFFYQALGIPKIILGGGQEFTEASSKIGYISYEQVYVREQTEFIADFWNQVGIKIKLNKPVSIQNELISDTNKDPAALGMQPNDMIAGRGQ